MSITLDDRVSPFLKKLFDRSEGLGLQAMSKGASTVRERMKTDSERAGYSNYNQRSVNGHRLLGIKRKRLYDRLDKTMSGKKQVSMGSLIRFKQYPLSRTVLVGWLNTKGYTTTNYNAGVPTTGAYVKGTKTKHIAQMMADGGRVRITDKQRNLFARSGFSKIAKRGYYDRKPHRFMNSLNYLSILNKRAQSEFYIAVKEFARSA